MPDYPATTKLWPGAEKRPPGRPYAGIEKIPKSYTMFCESSDNQTSQIKKHVCSQCGESFDKPIELARHSRKHK